MKNLIKTCPWLVNEFRRVVSALLVSATLVAVADEPVVEPGRARGALAVWDFDGTILKGDCSEGLRRGTVTVYPGLIADCIRAGFAADYRGDEGVARFWLEYAEKIAAGRKREAYEDGARIFAGAEVEKIEAFARKRFAETMKPHLFAYSLKRFRELESAGVENHVVSASPEFFVQAAAETLGVPRSRVHGIRLAVKDGRLVNRIVGPFPYGDGKTAWVRLLEKSSGRKALYGFGNSYGTDGPFLKAIARQNGTALMINGGKTVPGMTELFVCTNLETTCGASAVSDAETHGSTEMNPVGSAPVSRTVRKGGVRVLFIGNSITLHEPMPSIGWTNRWGMAASAREKDYVHLVTAGIERETGRKADVLVRNLAAFERGFRDYDFSRIDDLVAFRPDYLVVALGENVPALADEADGVAYRTAFKKLLERFTCGRMKPHVAVRGAFWPNPARDALMAQAASDLAMPFVTAACRDKSMTARGLFAHAGVANHPGDKGMEMIAAAVLEALFPSSPASRRPSTDATPR